MMGEACLKEDTLMRVLVIGLTRELPLSPTDAMDIADMLVARAASAHTEGTVKHKIQIRFLFCC
jgi:integrator complex subunit 1